ncbi:MAG: M28 family peptidase [Bacteroidales bacterium]|nr:M28 family peptidase [Bacteroidales bacterium]
MPEIRLDRMYNDVETLTSVNPPRNYKNPDSLNKIAEYIHDELARLDCKVKFQPYQVQEIEYKNVIASFSEGSGERIIVGAHYDVYGDYPGADDNASAVAGLLETARLLNMNNAKLKSPVDFVAYTLEEPPFFDTEFMGSAVHARFLHDNNIPIKLMICFEMIGYYSDQPNSQGFPLPGLSLMYPDKGNFIAVVGKFSQRKTVKRVKELMKKYSEIDVYPVAIPFLDSLAGLSDQKSYWKYNYPAVMINDTSFFRNPNYHSETDTIDTLNFEKMGEVVKGVYGTIINY